MRSVADEISDWSSDHQPGRAEEAADWVRQVAAQVEGDTPRRVAYEGTRRLRRSPWPAALVAASVVATVGVVVVWSVRRRRRSVDPAQQRSSVES